MIASGAIDHVDAERPAPRVVGGEEAAEHGPERRADARRWPPQAANAVARSPPWNVVDRMASVAGSISDAPRPSMIASPSDEAGRRSDDSAAISEPEPEQRGADDEDPPVPVDVAEAAADDQERGEREGVAGDDPLQARQGRVELPQDRRDRDVEDRVVDDDDDRRHQRDGQREPLLWADAGCVAAGGVEGCAGDRHRPSLPCAITSLRSARAGRDSKVS